MPCITDPDPRTVYIREGNRRADMLEAMLCHAFTAAESQILNAPLEVYLECGTKRVDMQAWWDAHKEKDRVRKEKEARELAVKQEQDDREEKLRQDREDRQRIIDAMPPEVRRLFQS